MGISAALLPRVFEMFTQGERDHARGREGLGIGLALVKRLVELHKGRVEAHSDGPGQGSTFSIRLPLAARQLPQMGMHLSPASGRAGTAPRSQPTASRQRILVVDDNQDAATSLGMLLRVLGNDVRVAGDGPSALEIFKSFAPAVVLLDLGMPGMSGYEVAQRLRELQRSRNLKLVALTGWGQEDDRRRTREAGFDHHLVKPVNVDALEVLLADAVALNG
jgi:CheY-like chemotaxis protein